MAHDDKKLSLADAWRTYELIEVMHDFLHQPEKYKTVDDVERWLQSGVYAELAHVYYKIVSNWFPPDEEDRVDPPPGVPRRFPE
jgi:hypothetical protein